MKEKRKKREFYDYMFFSLGLFTMSYTLYGMWIGGSEVFLLVGSSLGLTFGSYVFFKMGGWI